MDIELAVQAIQLAPSLDHIVLFSGDGDFRSLVADLQLRGKRVSVISTLQSNPPMIADELRRQADQFIDLADLEPIICRDPSTRASARRRERRTRRSRARRSDEAPGSDDGDDPQELLTRSPRGAAQPPATLRDEIPGDVDLPHATLAVEPVGLRAREVGVPALAQAIDDLLDARRRSIGAGAEKLQRLVVASSEPSLPRGCAPSHCSEPRQRAHRPVAGRALVR